MTSDIESVTAAISQNKLPSKFWDLPVFAGMEHVEDVHASLTQSLQDESPDADTLELMMMERVCFIYIYMRAWEMQGMGDSVEESQPFKFGREYKDLMGLWITMAADLRKTRMKAEEIATIRNAVVMEIGKAIKESLKGLDPKVAEQVQGKLLYLVQ